jgi:hypothetical protein
MLGSVVHYRGLPTTSKRSTDWLNNNVFWSWIYCVSAELSSTVGQYSDIWDSCAWVSVGAYHATNITLQWRLPLALACFGPLALLIGLPFIPGTFFSHYSTFR